jgi:hypothetical protein
MADKVETDRGAVETKVEDPAVLETKDEFSEAFEEAGKVGEKADLSAADDPAKIKEEPPVVVPPVVTPPVVETPSVVTSPATEQQPGETDEKYEQRYKTLQGIHKHDRETWETEKAKLLSDLEEAKKPKTPEKPIPETTEEKKIVADAFIDSLTEEQKEQLAVYEQDFDVVSKMEGIKRKVELGKLRKEMMDTFDIWKKEFVTKLTETETNLTSRIAPAVKLAEDSDQEAHFSMIRDGYVREDGTEVLGHADFEKYRDDGSLMTWIESKPKYLQSALKEAYSKGAAVDVIDLLTDFKKESNIPLTPLPSAEVIPIDSKKAAKKQALTTVTTRRGAVNPSVAVVDDFEGAFDEALHK